jgi:hypothetical protein
MTSPQRVHAAYPRPSSPAFLPPIAPQPSCRPLRRPPHTHHTSPYSPLPPERVAVTIPAKRTRAGLASAVRLGRREAHLVTPHLVAHLARPAAAG